MAVGYGGTGVGDAPGGTGVRLGTGVGVGADGTVPNSNAPISHSAEIPVAVQGTLDTALVSPYAFRILADGINGRAAGEQGMRSSRTAVVPQRAKFGIYA